MEAREAISGKGAVGATHYGADRHATREPKAQRITTEEMKRLGSEEGDLRRGRKVAVARRLRHETTMSLKWIAQRLQLDVCLQPA